MIKMIIRRGARTCVMFRGRIASISVTYVHCNQQIADIFEGANTHEKWDGLMVLLSVSLFTTSHIQSLPLLFACSADGEEKPSVY